MPKLVSSSWVGLAGEDAVRAADARHVELGVALVELEPTSGEERVDVGLVPVRDATDSMEITKNGQRVRVETIQRAVRIGYGGGVRHEDVIETVRFVPVTRQGIPDLDRLNGRGHNGNRTSCQHATPGLVPSYGKQELVQTAAGPRTVWATYCAGCQKRLWDNREVDCDMGN